MTVYTFESEEDARAKVDALRIAYKRLVKRAREERRRFRPMEAAELEAAGAHLLDLAMGIEAELPENRDPATV